MMRKCPGCGTYTLKAACPKDGTPTVSPHPAKYSPGDKYGKYRRMLQETNA